MHQIEYSKVSKEYIPGIKVLDSVSFSIGRGEFVFIVGPSGAGKSTIVCLLIGEEKPTGGEVRFNSEIVLDVPHEKIPDLRRKIGVVFQDYKLLDSKTVYDNVAVALEVVGADKEEMRNIIPNILSLVGLTNQRDSFPSMLSGGERQRVAIARALAHEPDVLVADEATGMIDPDSADERIVNSLKKRVIRIEKGKIISDIKGGKYRA
jgi:cell division transport system ATP-binding protein